MKLNDFLVDLMGISVAASSAQQSHAARVGRTRRGVNRHPNYRKLSTSTRGAFKPSLGQKADGVRSICVWVTKIRRSS